MGIITQKYNNKHHDVVKDEEKDAHRLSEVTRING